MDKQLVEAGYGHINEAAIIAGGGLRTIVECDLEPEDLPIPFQDLAELYWYEVLKPEFERMHQP